MLSPAEKVREAPEDEHYLIIDEINRGNVAKVFGEWYSQVEYRDKEIELQYSAEPCDLPKNFDIIGTMDTAVPLHRHGGLSTTPLL